MKMARITDGVIDTVIVPLEGFSIEECFHSDVLVQYVPVADDVQPGWIVTEDGIVAPESEPIAPEPKAEEVAEEPVVEEVAEEPVVEEVAEKPVVEGKV